MRRFEFGAWKAKIVAAPLTLLPDADPRQLRRELHANLGYPQPNSGTQRMAIQGPPTEQDLPEKQVFASWIGQARYSTLTSGLGPSEELKLSLTSSLALVSIPNTA